jgi:hypothetical protein
MHLFWCMLAACLLLASPARAGFIGNYAFEKFTLTNQNADGVAETPDGGLSIILTGGNNGSGLNGTTDLFITAVISGMVHFQYSYFSLDTPGFDTAGFLVDNVFTPLANSSGDFGSGSYSVVAGHSFGFRVATLDNLGEPGLFTVSDFTVQGATSGVPEPGTWTTALLAGAILTAVFKRRVSRRQEVEK